MRARTGGLSGASSVGDKRLGGLGAAACGLALTPVGDEVDKRSHTGQERSQHEERLAQGGGLVARVRGEGGGQGDADDRSTLAGGPS